jgi:hypothetical protein
MKYLWFVKIRFLLLGLVLMGSGCVSDLPQNSNSLYAPPNQAIEQTTQQIPDQVQQINTAQTKAVTRPDVDLNSGTAPNGYYKNVDGKSVSSPYMAPSAPTGASAQCKDGTYSFSQHRQGTCSRHGGVSTWY